MRKGEILALEWTDIDFAKRTISISKSVEEIRQEDGWLRQVKGPKTARGNRTIEIDAGLAALLAGLPRINGLCFPALRGEGLRCPQSVYSAFVKRAREIGFDMRFHDLRASHATIVLDKGVPVHVVAKRIGDDPATLLRWYAKRTKKADSSAASVIGSMTQGVL